MYTKAQCLPGAKTLCTASQTHPDNPPTNSSEHLQAKYIFSVFLLYYTAYTGFLLDFKLNYYVPSQPLRSMEGALPGPPRSQFVMKCDQASAY